MTAEATQHIVYRFRFADGETAQIDSHALEGIPYQLPEWTRLETHQCPNCPLKKEDSPHCPLAIQLIPLLRITGNRYSHQLVDVEVETPDRTTLKTTTVQSAMGSLMGLLCATSDCPHMQFLSSLAEFHLPFSNELETVYRVLANYLVSQYIMKDHGNTPDWDLDGLRARYSELITVNQHMAHRIRSASEKDGAVNALVILDSLARALQFSMDIKFEELKPYFRRILKQGM
jgi:hypothetical protein